MPPRRWANVYSPSSADLAHSPPVPVDFYREVQWWRQLLGKVDADLEHLAGEPDERRARRLRARAMRIRQRLRASAGELVAFDVDRAGAAVRVTEQGQPTLLSGPRRRPSAGPRGNTNGHQGGMQARQLRLRRIPGERLLLHLLPGGGEVEEERTVPLRAPRMRRQVGKDSRGWGDQKRASGANPTCSRQGVRARGSRHGDESAPWAS